MAPGVTDTELGADITEEDSINGLKEIRKLAISPESIAEAFSFFYHYCIKITASAFSREADAVR
ncbi:hypothetical protein [Listeria immobilis]|uniref:hypothetical protein n=1 Tax=Listeria immobilis TaxID=2713502 RepID=UPI0021AB611A|nr:hypothetical protein [Listeria immobilis]